MPSLRDITGMKFGRLMVVKREGSNGSGNACWECVCECGTRKVVSGKELTHGRTVSCGCYSSEIFAERARTHSMSGHPAYASWIEMRNRCRNPNHDSYPDYGGRGIQVCDRWLDSFENFWSDMGPTHEPGLTIDRIDVHGAYEPANCRWASRKQQSRNTRRNLVVTFRGEDRCLGEWCELLDLPYHTVYTRLSRGWPVERALTEHIHR